MGDLHARHRKNVTRNIGSPKKFGDLIRFHTRDASVDYTVYGSVNKISPKLSDGSQPAVIGHSVGIAVLRDTLLEAAGFPDNPDYLDNVPTVGWLVTLTDRWTNEEKAYTIEKGQDPKDDTIGLDSFWLVDYV